MIVWTVILLTVLGTAILSGVLGMAGGLVLMGVLVLLLPVSAAMIVHGAVQAASNGARFLFLREHAQWRIVPPYAAGAALVAAAFAAVTLVPEPGVVLMLIGAFPWLARATPHFSRLDIRRPATAFACGAVVTAAQLLGGASGPLLDAFYLHASRGGRAVRRRGLVGRWGWAASGAEGDGCGALDRYQVVASKALTQTLGHLVKVGYYGLLAGSAAADVSAALLAVACLVAVAGARIGTRLLARLPDDRFRRISGYVILGLGAVCFARGALETFG